MTVQTFAFFALRVDAPAAAVSAVPIASTIVVLIVANLVALW